MEKSEDNSNFEKKSCLNRKNLIFKISIISALIVFIHAPIFFTKTDTGELHWFSIAERVNLYNPREGMWLDKNNDIPS
ncbi:hypothetical protein [Clostridium sp.]|uniref:hypothetical protein n=1 Tax=Clostridium sp. TaxID=1506 RepID=UPI002FCBC214